MTKLNYPEGFTLMQCETIAECFIQSVRDGYDSIDFAEKMLNTDWGVMILTDKRMIEYSDYHYMYEGILKNINIKYGLMYEEVIMEYAGYLYKYWVSYRGTSPKVIWKIAPIERIAKMYDYLHTQDWEVAIDYLCERRC